MKLETLIKSALYLLVILAPFSSIKAQNATVPPNCDLQALAIQAALGDSTAQYNLAVEFHKGEKVPQDLAKSAALWGMAVKAGDIQAHNNLGHLNYYGRGIKQNLAEGVRLWRVAATNGFPESMVHLGNASADGKFLKKDYVEAYAWVVAGRQAAIADEDTHMGTVISKMADDNLAVIEPNLTRAQIPLAKRRAALYVARYVQK